MLGLMLGCDTKLRVSIHKEQTCDNTGSMCGCMFPCIR